MKITKDFIMDEPKLKWNIRTMIQSAFQSKFKKFIITKNYLGPIHCTESGKDQNKPQAPQAAEAKPIIPIKPVETSQAQVYDPVEPPGLH
mmetsp:Transcript_28728/g.32843  ORF Transcript_28728/g.32843 Transcript_28728/m.32843 type:complete len:90 (+) Transcript_28728:273-542(+)